MRDLVQKGIRFIRENPRMVYSLVLIFFIPLAFYFNTRYTIGRFEDNLTQVIRSKAVLAEDIVKFIARDSLDDPAKLEQLIRETKALNEDVGEFKIYSYDKEQDLFRIEASDVPEEAGSELSGADETLFHRIAWNEPDNNVSYVSQTEGGRHWNVLEALQDERGERRGVILISFPLGEFDRINRQAETMSYLVMLFTILVVLLLSANNARLFGYALTLTKLKEVDAMKDTFISMASHELKAPLVSMRGNVEFLKEENFSQLDEKGRHYVENIDFSAERMVVLVNDILEVSRLEGNRIPINPVKTDPAPLLEKMIEESGPQAREKKLALTYAGGELPAVLIDPDRCKQILLNLVNNAIKYTAQGEVRVLTEKREKELLITVADSGVGISAEDQAKLFQKFSRIYNEETKAVSGTGLGLWISRELARKMGGDITVESIRGVGSHFTLHLPLA